MRCLWAPLALTRLQKQHKAISALCALKITLLRCGEVEKEKKIYPHFFVSLDSTVGF